MVEDVLDLRHQHRFRLLEPEQPARLQVRIEHELRQGQVDIAVGREPRIDPKPVEFGRDRRIDVVVVVVPFVPSRARAPDVRVQELHRLADRTECPIAQEVRVHRVEVVPPQALHHPRRLAHLRAPRRHRIRHLVHLHRVGRMRKEGARQSVVVASPRPAHGQQEIDEVGVREVLVDMVRGKGDPERLLQVVVRVVVAVPGRADPPVAPVRKQPWTVDARPDRAIEEVQVAVPGPLEELVAEPDAGLAPVVPPRLPGVCRRDVVRRARRLRAA